MPGPLSPTITLTRVPSALAARVMRLTALVPMYLIAFDTRFCTMLVRTAALHAANARFQESHGPAAGTIAAYLAFYPSCNIELTGTIDTSRKEKAWISS